MKWIRSAALSAALLMTPMAWGAPDAAEEEDDQERVTGKRPPPLDLDSIKTPRSAEMAYENDPEMTTVEYGERPYGPQTYLGAQALQLDPDFVYAIQSGLELIYLRDYTGARDYFLKVEEKFPGTGVASVCDLLVWQALMLENFDFRFDKQYWVSTGNARKELGAALDKPGNEGWEHFLMAGVVGIEAIHTMRKQEYVKALNLAFRAMDHISRSRAAAPDFVDITLADGMYNYWRSVVTMSSSVLPDFGDKRVEGIEQMSEVESGAVFLSGPATLALAFTWLEEGELRRAANSCSRNRRKYPKNIINNLMTGTTFLYQRKFDAALTAFNQVLEEDPKNKRVRYWLGLTHLRAKNFEMAEKELKAYLDVDYMEDWQKAAAQYRLGQTYTRQQKHAEAYAAYQAAVKADGHKGAKKAVDRMKKRRKEGKIDF